MKISLKLVLVILSYVSLKIALPESIRQFKVMFEVEEILGLAEVMPG